MCGISGFYCSNESISKEDLYRMTSVLSHRGPDAEGYFYENGVGLGHKRLSILDLSVSANQPMYSQSERYLIVFNGEVYNFREIAKELDIPLRTSSDTEIILEAFAKFGIDFVHKLNGMFAIAIYDRSEKSLYLFRDRMGIKPLFYYWDGRNFAFASEIKSILKVGLISSRRSLNPQAINDFLQLGYIPEPNTIYDHIHKFPSGHRAIIGEGFFRLSSYWKLSEQIRVDVEDDFEEAKKKLKELLTSSVKYRLISDVPYGVFLSGGIDSSLIAAIASSISTEKVKTFSIGFKESKFNEAAYAKSIAGYLKTDHHEFTVSHNDAIELFEDLDKVYDEPYADHSAIPTLMVSKLARKYVKMTLSGDGGDELFFGYGSYLWAKRLSNPVLYSLRKPIASLLSLGSSRYKRVSDLLKCANREKIKSHIFSQEQYFFSEKEIAEVLAERIDKKPFTETIDTFSRKLDPMEDQALFDLKYYLKDDLLVKIDRATMFHSLETRVPLLDYRVVQYALNLHPSLKINKNTSKYILKEILYDYIPKEYFDRPKRGFTMPLSVWLKHELKYMIEEFLCESMIRKYGVLNVSEVNKVKEKYFNGCDYYYGRIWLLISLQRFLKNNL